MFWRVLVLLGCGSGCGVFWPRLFSFFRHPNGQHYSPTPQPFSIFPLFASRGGHWPLVRTQLLTGEYFTPYAFLLYSVNEGHYALGVGLGRKESPFFFFLVQDVLLGFYASNGEWNRQLELVFLLS
jgi:hypothetical protein